MRIGVAKEIKSREYRVALTPAGALELVRHGHEVIVESSGGEGSGFADEAYEAVGARTASVDEVWAEAELLLKVKEPIESEYARLREGLVLFTYLHIAADEPLTRALVESGITADVDPNTDPFCRHINYLYTNGITAGCDLTPDFCETSLLTRAQMSAFVARAILGSDAAVPVSGSGYNCVSGGSSNFTDVPPTDGFCRHINYLSTHGIVAGYGGGIFGPNDPITRGQGAVFMTKGFNLTLYGP